MKTHVLRNVISLALTVALASTAWASDLSTQARLPADMRDRAQKAADEFKAGHFDAAADLYQSIINAHPDSLYAWSNLGVVRFQEGQLDDARDAFRHALTLNPKDELVLIDLGIVYYQLNLFPRAIQCLQTAVAINPGDASAHRFLSSAYDKDGKTQEAQVELQKARELDSEKAQDGQLIPGHD
jgi:Flp pilus assembly protein TadD